MTNWFGLDCVFEPGWLVRDGTVLASLELAASRGARAKGLLGRPGIDGVLALPRTRSVHSLTLQFDLDVAFVDSSMTVIRTVRLRPNRVTFPVWKAQMAIEAESGAFGRWNLNVGDVLEIRSTDAAGLDGSAHTDKRTPNPGLSRESQNNPTGTEQP